MKFLPSQIAYLLTDRDLRSNVGALLRYVAAWLGPALGLAAYVLLKPLGWGGLAWPLLALNWIAAFVDRDRQFLHDRIAGTRIVRS